MVRTDTPSDKFNVDAQDLQDVLRQIRERFIDERVNGWTPKEGMGCAGQPQAPVSREEAEARWKAVEHQFQKVMLEPSADAVRKVLPNSKPLPASSNYSSDDQPGEDLASYEADWGANKPAGRRRAAVGAANDRAMAAEPSLRHGESLVSRDMSKLFS